MYIYINGRIERQEEAKISPYDHGYIYGLGLFETFRIYDGHPFLLDDHLARLREGLSALSIDFIPVRKDVVEIITKLLHANDINNAYVRFNVSAGVGDIGLQTGHYQEPTVIVFIKPLPSAVEAGYEKKGVILKQVRNTPEGKFRIKSHHFLNNILGKREIGSNPSTEGIFLTKEGYAAEGITSNLFWVKGNELFTPALETGILDGITRQFVIKIARSLRIEVHIGCYNVEELLSSDEAFVTNSIQEIVPLREINNVLLHGKNGIITRKLQKIYTLYRKTLWSRSALEGRSSLDEI